MLKVVEDMDVMVVVDKVVDGEVSVELSMIMLVGLVIRWEW